MERNRKVVLLVGIIMSLFLILALKSTNRFSLTGMATFGVGICINTPPAINYTSCPNSTYENETLNCSFTAITDIGENINFSSSFYGSKTLFSVNLSGHVYKALSMSDIGNYTYNITTFDDSTCPNDNAAQNFSIEVLSIGNHPPYLISNIPDQSWLQDTVLVPYNLDNYFDDIDGDPLTYTSSYTANINIQIDVFGYVTLTPAPGFYGIEYVYFYAWDPDNASAQSNRVKLTVRQKQDQQQEESDNYPDTPSYPSLSGFSPISCFPEWECGNWSECFPQGFWARECIDSNNCNSSLFKPNITEFCDYTPTCSDKIQNGDEEGIDCGGICNDPCGPPASCFDGIKNEEETGVDCGGLCKPCQDKKTCFDGIQNQDEDGVDCGGVCMEKCVEEQRPAAGAGFDVRSLLLYLLILAVIMVLTYETYHKRRDIMKLMKKIKRMYRKKLEFSVDKTELFIAKLDLLEESLPKTLPHTALSKLSNIITDYLPTLMGLRDIMTYEELARTIKDSGMGEELKKSILSLFKDISEIEFSTALPSIFLVQELITETKSIAMHSTHTSKEMLSFQKQASFEPKSEIDKAYNSLIWINLNLLNNRISDARNGFISLHKNILAKKISDKHLINSMRRAGSLIKNQMQNEEQ